MYNDPKFVPNLPRLMNLIEPWIAYNQSGLSVEPETYAAVSDDDTAFLVQTLEQTIVVPRHYMAPEMINMFLNAGFITPEQARTYNAALTNKPDPVISTQSLASQYFTNEEKTQ